MDIAYRAVPDLMSLAGRTAVVTGAGRGIGRAVALRLAEAGAHVVATDISADLAAETAHAVAERGWSASHDVLDATRAEDFDRVLDACDRTPTILVNNAGTYAVRDWRSLTSEEWDLTQAQNLRSAFFGCQAAARRIVDAGLTGSIVNISSIAGERLAPANPPDYAAAKAGVSMLTKNLGYVLGPHGIRVNGIAPGFVVTPGVLASERFRQSVGLAAATPTLGRQLDGDDIALAALFLTSELARMVNSEVLVVDGGGSWNVG